MCEPIWFRWAEADPAAPERSEEVGALLALDDAVDDVVDHARLGAVHPTRDRLVVAADVRRVGEGSLHLGVDCERHPLGGGDAEGQPARVVAEDLLHRRDLSPVQLGAARLLLDRLLRPSAALAALALFLSALAAPGSRRPDRICGKVCLVLHPLQHGARPRAAPARRKLATVTLYYLPLVTRWSVQCTQ